MWRLRAGTVFAVGLAWAMVGHTTSSKAQSVESPNQFSIEVFRPEFKSSDYTFLSSAAFIGIQEGVEGPVTVRLQIPLAYVRTDTKAGSGWEFRPGNPSLGLSWSSPQRPAELGFSLQAPILPNDAKVRAMRIADISRLEAFVPDLWDFSVHSVVGSDLDLFQAEAGLHFWLPLHDAVELVANYSVTARAPLVNMLASLQVRGRAALTDETLVFGERTFHEAGAKFEFYIGSVRPGILIRKPIQGREIADWVYGISLTFY